LITSKIKEQINIMARYEDPPNIIIIHIGGYDMGHIRLGYLQLMLRRLFDWLWVKYPESFIVWSQIIPRINWRYSDNVEAMDRTRRRINSTDAKYVVCNGGGYIHYPDLKPNTTFLIPDGVHLTPLGNELFLNTIQGALEVFVTRNEVISYPR
jgi:lysophospholipase L1-like esterase